MFRKWIGKNGEMLGVDFYDAWTKERYTGKYILLKNECLLYTKSSCN